MGSVLGDLVPELGGFSEEQKTLIDVSRLVSQFLAKGSEWKDGVKIPASELRYLEAVTPTLGRKKVSNNGSLHGRTEHIGLGI